MADQNITYPVAVADDPSVNRAEIIFAGQTGALALPSGTDLQRPESPVEGMLRYGASGLEVYNGTFWVSSGAGNAVALVFPYVYHSEEPENSLLNYEPSEVGERAMALCYYKGLKPAGASVWEAFSLTGMGGIDNTSYDSTNGFVVEGQYARWRLIPEARQVISAVGIRADGISVDQVARFERLAQAVSLVNGTLVGQGTVLIDKTLHLTDVFTEIENVELYAVADYFGYLTQIKGGLATKNAGRLEMHAWGTPGGAWGVFPLSKRRSPVTFDYLTGVVNDPGHGRTDNELVRFEVVDGIRPEGISGGVYYRVTNPTTDTYQLATLAGGSLVAFTTNGSGALTAYHGGRKIVTISTASPAVVTEAAHGRSSGDKVCFTSTGALPTGLTSLCYYEVVVVDTDTYTLKSLLTGAAINTTVDGSGVYCVDGSELEWQNVNEGVNAFRIYGDSSGSSSYKLHPSYTGRGVILEGNTEKEKIEVHAVGCDEILTEISTKTATVTLDSTTNQINWTANALTDMYVVQLGGSLPPELFAGRKYKVINKLTDSFQITELYSNTPIDFSTNGTGTITCLAENGSSGGSADTNKIEIIGTRSRRLFTSGVDNTSHVELNYESPVDLGRRIITTDGVVLPDPRIMIRNGKNAHLSGNLRTHNGQLYVLVDREGTNAADGTDCVHFDNLRFTDNCYGTLLFARRVQKLTGRIYARNSHDARVNMNDSGAGSGIGNIPCANIHIGQVYSGDFGVTLLACNGREGLRIGDATNNLYPRNWNMGRNTVVMTPLSNIAFNPRTSVFPTDKNAFVIEKMVGGSVPFDQIEGNIRLEAGCSGVRIEVPAIWIGRYTLSADASATATVVVRGSVAFSDVAFLPWLRSGINLVVESLSDKDGVGAAYMNGKWNISGLPLEGVTGDFASISHDFNNIFKRTGQNAYDGTRLLVATGNADSDPWAYYDGSNANTVGYQAATTALVARMSTTPSTARQKVYDKLYYELGKAGLLSGKLILLYVLGAHEEATALLNLISTSYNLTKQGDPVFTIDQGFTGTGLSTDYLATGYDATINAEGMGQNDGHIGVFAITESSSGEMIGSENQKMSARVAGGGSNRVRANVTSGIGWTSANAIPRHVLGNRVVSTEQTAWDNGVLVATGLNTSNGLPDTMSVLKYGLGATTGQVFAAHVGTGLNSTEIAALYSALRICYYGITAT